MFRNKLSTCNDEAEENALSTHFQWSGASAPTPERLSSKSSVPSTSNATTLSVPGLFSIHDTQGIGFRRILDIAEKMMRSAENQSSSHESDDKSVASVLGTHDSSVLAFEDEMWDQLNFGSTTLDEYLQEPMPTLPTASLPEVSASTQSCRKRQLTDYEEDNKEDSNDADDFSISGIFDEEFENKAIHEQIPANLSNEQNSQWLAKFKDLRDYRNRHGHCSVPCTYHENRPLNLWVKRQRYQYKIMLEGKTSAMNPERVQALNSIGFIWDSQASSWYERLNELKVFKNEFGHCNVPSSFAGNPQLSTWVKGQRRQWRMHRDGQPSTMTLERMQKLEEIGFEWELRPSKCRRVSILGSEA